MGKPYYRVEEIKDKFKSYIDIKKSNITPDEYEIFCGHIQYLPKEIVDRVLTEIEFVMLSADPKKGNPACYVNIRKGIEEEKEGIIVLTPYIFGAPYIDENGKERRINSSEPQCALHEVAHHILGHYKYNSPEDKEDKEKMADAQVKEWIEKWWDFNDNE